MNAAPTASKRFADDVWVVIPLYNEATVIGGVLAELLPVFPQTVCIDDGSRDGSGTVARAAGAHVVNHPINLGQGAALARKRLG